ncbi:hypothetical protein PsorP6_015630 [Peronosclerospora sorghi]|uniref:Uncharacterized protein n=1 Tax=Peronosclerospora sorghi TaxID=230839 RepID=A0ACC0WMT2_9STRA|nr:hypothetical protein PsorP6_015630 [Peronosclerospora sorghi]
MSSASRVPLLVKGKHRKPSRVSIVPRAKPPSSGPRTKEQVERSALKTTLPDHAEKTNRAVMMHSKEIETCGPGTTTSTSLISNLTNTAFARPGVTSDDTRSNPLLPSSSHVSPADDKAAPSSPLAVEPGQAGGNAPIRSIPATASTGHASPRVLPVVVPPHPDRLVKITSTGPLYRPSPVLRPGARGGARLVTTRSATLLPDRRPRTLDIKPHQSPRRSVVPHDMAKGHGTPASPLLLGGTPDDDDKPPEPSLGTTSTRARAPKRPHVRENTQEPPRRRSRRRRAERPSLCDTASRGREREEECGRRGVMPNVYVPARERATLWAKALLHKRRDEDVVDRDDRRASETTQAPKRSRRKHPRPAASGSSACTAVGSRLLSRPKMDALMQKAPSEMTMGELALTVPRGHARGKRHEREETASETLEAGARVVDGPTSTLLNGHALQQVQGLGLSSACSGSVVTPQVQLIDGAMVVVENTIKVGDEWTPVDACPPERRTMADDARRTAGPRPHAFGRYKSLHAVDPAKRWGRDETKHFYYCLTQVGPNFSLMATLFPTRSRRELKSKFKYEEKSHARLVEIALRAATAPLDAEMLDVLSQMLDRRDAQRKDTTQRGHEDDDRTSVTRAMALSPLSTPLVCPEPFKVTLTDDELFSSRRHASFDFSG